MVLKHYCHAHLKERVEGKLGRQENANLSRFSPKLKNSFNGIKLILLNFPLYQNANSV